MNGRSHAIGLRLTVQFLLILALLAGLALANYLILQSQIAAGRRVAEVLNLSSNQRALLQQSALAAQQLASSDVLVDRSEVRRTLLEMAQCIEDAHFELIRKDSQVPPPESVRMVYFDAPWMLDTETRTYLVDIRSLATAPDRELEGDNPRVVAIRETAASGRLSRGLDAVVAAYQHEAGQRTGQLQALAAWSFGSTLAVLGVTGWFVFRPTIRRVREDVQELADLSEGLERRVAERTAVAAQRTEALALSEQALHDQGRILRLVLDSMGDGVVVVDNDSQFRIFNPRAREIFRVGRHDDIPDLASEGWPGRDGVRLFLPDGRTPFPAGQLPLMRAARGEAVDRAEMVLRCPPEDDVRWLSVTARPLVDGGGVLHGGVALVRDITERIKAEQQLRDSEALYHSLVDNLPLYVLRKDLEGRFTFVNHPMCRLLRKTPEEVLGKTDRDFYPDRLASKYRRDDQRVVRSGEVRQEVEEHRTPDGKIMFVETLKAPVRDGERRITGTQTVFLDVTARVEAERKAVQSERLAAIGQMVAGVAHESRNALQQIQACCGLLEWRLNGDEEAHGLLADLQKAQDRLHRLFEDLRGYAAPMAPERRRRDVRRLVAEAWEALARLRDGREASLRERPFDGDPHCEVDGLQCEQVFRNVLENAVAAGADPVVIDVAYGEARIDGKAALRVVVRDNGPGLSAEQREKIFQPFYTTRPQGTGLGMAIARRIVEAHGGRIEVGPADAAGTAILITLPRGA